MTKLISSLILISFINTNIFFGQILNFTIVLHHFHEHKTENQKIDFFTFLKIHYKKDVNHADDRHMDHKRLPFKQNQGNSNLILLAVGDVCKVLNFRDPFSTTKKTLFFPVFLYNHNSHNSVWQPPKGIC